MSSSKAALQRQYNILQSHLQEELEAFPVRSAFFVLVSSDENPVMITREGIDFKKGYQALFMLQTREPATISPEAGPLQWEFQHLFSAARSRWGTQQADTLSFRWVEAGDVKFTLAVDMALLGNMTERTGVRSIEETLALCNHAH